MRARVSRLVVALVLLVLMGCQAEAVVDLDVEADGAGTVTVELMVDAAVDEALGGFAEQLRVDDLERAGWEVDLDLDVDGGADVTATKRVPTRDDWQAVLDEIAGPGVFNDVLVATAGDFANTRQQLSFNLDLSDGWDLFSDEGVAAALDGEPFGAPIEDLTDGRSIDEILSLTLQASVVSETGAAPLSNTWEPRFDSEDELRVVLAATNENSTAILLRWIAFALGALFVLATLLAITGVVLQRRSDRLRSALASPSSGSQTPTVPDDSAGPASERAEATVPARESVRLVVIEPLAVLYQQRSVEEELLAFIRAKGGSARTDTILEGHRGLLAGGADTTAFWELCGLEESPGGLDAEFVNTRELDPDAAAFLAEMQRLRIPVAATTTDAQAWSTQMRERDRLSAVWPWLVSGAVGSGTNNGAMFEALRRESGVAHEHCLYVDSSIENLDAARKLGAQTALFDTGDVDLPDDLDHPIVTDFEQLF